MLAGACPADPQQSGAALSVIAPGAATKRLSLAELGQLPAKEVVQQRTLSSGGATSVEQSIRYAGPLLRTVIESAWPEIQSRRDARWLLIEAVATDGYRGLFSWGELFNASVGDQVLVIVRTDGAALDAVTGPVALRALADLRPGPRHVRNLCAVVIRAA